MTSGTCACGRVPDRVFCDTKVGEVVHAEEVPLNRGWVRRVRRVFVVNTVEGSGARTLCLNAREMSSAAHPSRYSSTRMTVTHDLVSWCHSLTAGY